MLFDADAFEYSYANETPGETMLHFDGLIDFVVRKNGWMNNGVEVVEDLKSEIRVALLGHLWQKKYKAGFPFTYFSRFIRDRGINALKKWGKQLSVSAEDDHPLDFYVPQCVTDTLDTPGMDDVQIDIIQEHLDSPRKPISEIISRVMREQKLTRLKARKIVNAAVISLRCAALASIDADEHEKEMATVLAALQTDCPSISALAETHPKETFLLVTVLGGLRLNLPSVHSLI